MKLTPKTIYSGKVCLSWRQRDVASDQHIRLHRVAHETPDCQLGDMVQREDFEDESMAQQAIQRPTAQIFKRPISFKEYKRCKHCWENGDDKVIQI